MKDIRARVAEALEARVRGAEHAAAITGEWVAYDVTYAAHAAFLMGDNPIDAAWDTLKSAPTTAPLPVLIKARAAAVGVERAVTEALAA